MTGNQLIKSLFWIALAIGVGFLTFYLARNNNMSEDAITWGILILVLVIMAGGFVYGVWAGKKRKEALTQIAAEMGYTFLPDDKDFNAQLQSSAPFEIFSRGRSRKAYNILRGQRRDAQADVFDYRYTTGGGRSSQTHRQTLALLTLPQAELVQFSIRPRGFFDNLAAKFGQKEINFESAIDFSKKYLVKGNDEGAVRRLFNPSVMALFEGQKNLSCEATANQLLVFRLDKPVKPEELRSFLDNATQLLELMRRPTYDYDYAR